MRSFLIKKVRFSSKIEGPKQLSKSTNEASQLARTKYSQRKKLKRFLELTGNINPDLVKVFYTNFHFDGDSLVSHVKGVDIKEHMQKGMRLCDFHY